MRFDLRACSSWLSLLLVSWVGSKSLADAKRKPAAGLVHLRLGQHQVQHVNWVRHAVFSPDGKMLALTNDRSCPSLWDLATKREIRRLVTEGPVPFIPSALAFSPDGKLMAGIHWGVVQLCSVATGKPLRHFWDRQGFSAMAFSPDGKVIAAGVGSEDKKFAIVLWETATGREKRRFVAHDAVINALAFSANGKKLVSLVHDGEASQAGTGAIALWDVATGNRLWSRGKIRPGTLSRDGSFFTDQAESGRIQIWRVGHSTCAHTLHVPNVRPAAELAAYCTSTSHLFSPDGTTLACMNLGGIVSLWDVRTGRLIRRFRGPPKKLEENTFLFDFSADGKLLATGNVSDGNNPRAVRLWDTLTGTEVLPENAHAGPVTCLAYARDGTTIISGSEDRTLRAWNATNGKAVGVLYGHDAAISSVAFNPAGAQVVSSSQDGELRLWDCARLESIHRSDQIDTFLPVRFSADGKRVIHKGRNGQTLAWNIPAGPLTRLALPSEARPWTTPDDLPFIKEPGVWGHPGVLRLLNSRFGGENRPALYGVAVSDDGRLLATAEGVTAWGGMVGPAYSLFVWEVDSGCEIARLRPAKDSRDVIKDFPGIGCSLAFSRNGWTLFSAKRPFLSLGPDLHAWSLCTGKEMNCLHAPPDWNERGPGHHGTINCLCASPDGCKLATGSSDGTVIIWDVSEVAQQKIRNAEAAELMHHWAQLNSANAAKAFRSMHRLACSPTEAVPFLARQLRALLPPEANRLTQLIDALGDDDFGVREKALASLTKLGEWAEPALRQARENNSTSPEGRHRIEHLLTKMTMKRTFRLQTVRAVATLEHIGTREACAALADLAKAFPNTLLENEAGSSLDRLRPVRKRPALSGSKRLHYSRSSGPPYPCAVDKTWRPFCSRSIR